jgi:transcriptional regulator with XRE-family HTH domain
VADGDGVGVRVRRFRRARGLSLEQAAGLAGVSKPYLSRLERGERSLDSRALLLRIASALEVSVADLTDSLTSQGTVSMPRRTGECRESGSLSWTRPVHRGHRSR